MRYEHSLLIRVAILLLFPIAIFYNVFLPLTIWPVYLLLKLLDFNAIISSNMIMLDNLPLLFISACIAPYAYYLMLALIMLTKDILPLTRIKMLLLASLLILSANVARIILLIYILSAFGNDAFQTVHIALWFFISTLYIAILWLLLAYIFKIKSIPVYSDFKFLLAKSFLRKKPRKEIGRNLGKKSFLKKKVLNKRDILP
jgi:exosortase/archaeosortase family protein